MTATQVFLAFLKKECSLKEYMFFKHIITEYHGNRYFKNRKIYKNTFVEDYLSRNNRALNNFMTRLFILAPNLVGCRKDNSRFYRLVDDWRKAHEGKEYYKEFTWHDGTKSSVPFKVRFNYGKSSGLYVQLYKRKWNKFLREYIDDSEKKISSPFKKGEAYSFKWKKPFGRMWNVEEKQEDDLPL